MIPSRRPRIGEMVALQQMLLIFSVSHGRLVQDYATRSVAIGKALPTLGAFNDGEWYAARISPRLLQFTFTISTSFKLREPESKVSLLRVTCRLTPTDYSSIKRWASALLP